MRNGKSRGSIPPCFTIFFTIVRVRIPSGLLKIKNKSMKTFINQKSEDMYLTLPFDIAQEVIGRMKVNGKCVIHLITTKVVDNCLKTTIKYHY